MTRHVVVGTAGHVDHGKTALVRALTGTETDRWEEEKRLGITIDLGFARLPLGEGLVASIVDVPGHEDFVRNMVAGATGVDVALLVVAADEGVMPQTVEHLAILEFLGVRSGVVVISKVDLVEADWLELVQADVATRLEGSSVRWETPVCFSATSGVGTEELKRALGQASAQAVQRSADDLFRMPVDRVFSAPGAGTVVTGTTWSGTVAAADDVRVLPGASRARVRSVEVHGEARQRAEPGRRTALALPGVDKGTVARGSVVVTDAAWRENGTLDVIVTLLPDARTLSQRSRVRLHLGTAEVMARVTPAGDDIPPGTTAAARLRLEQPLVARWGDRGVLRSYSPIRTIGGCVVVDPLPPLRPRRPQGLQDRAAADPAARVAEFVAQSGWSGLSSADLPVRVGVYPTEVTAVVVRAGALGVAAVGDRLFSGAVLREARKTTLESLEAHHRERSLEPGMPRELLRSVLQNPDLSDHVWAELVEEGRVAVDGGSVRLSTFQATVSEKEGRWVGAISQALEDGGPQGRTVDELCEVVPESPVRDLAEYLVRDGSAVRVGGDRYYSTGAAGDLREAILQEVRERGRAKPAELREKTGLTRKYLIPFLEWLDGTGYTVRDGDGRRLGPAAEASDKGS
jgi:selenocysteine-specific elongation factor